MQVFPGEEMIKCKPSHREGNRGEAGAQPQITVRIRTWLQSLKLTPYLQSGDPQRMGPEKGG